MMEQLKKILDRFLDWWKKFTSKQKTIIISVAAVLVLFFGILITILSQPKYALVTVCQSEKESSQVKELLEANEITYRVSDDGLEYEVITSQLANARILLGSSEILTTTYDLSAVFDGGFSTTEADKVKKYKLYLESALEEDLVTFTSVKEASVDLDLPEDDGTLISQDEEASAAVLLYIDGAFTQDMATGMAKFIATGLGNEDTRNITIIDQEGTQWFSGEDSFSASGNASSQMILTQQLNGIMAGKIKNVLIGTPLYGNVEVASNLIVDFSSSELVEHTYTNEDNVKANESLYESESTGSSGGVPGTDSNDETTVVYQDSENSSSTVSEQDIYYLPDEVVKTQTIPPGLVKYDDSSISVAATSYKIVKEEDAKRQGLLDGISWEDYKLANNVQTKLEVDTDILDLVAKATGIPAENISMVAYEEIFFEDKEGLNVNPTDIVQVALIVIILGLLAFVVLRSMRGQKATEKEVELSVEGLLQSTPEPELEDIELEEKSKTRKMIEKFVDENPEAVANLLRNWLTDGWH